MSKRSSTYRVIEILKLLDEGKLLCIEVLASSYETSTRSIRRDLELIREVFGEILISPQKGCYQSVRRSVLEETLDSTELYLLKEILTLSQRSDLSLSRSIDPRIAETITKEESGSPYLFKTKPFEEIHRHKELFRSLENAVRFHSEIVLDYVTLEGVQPFTLRPYRIVFINENFYLASESRRGVFTFSRIALIEKMTLTGKTFTLDYDLMAFIEWMQTPWAQYRGPYRSNLFEVMVEVPRRQARYFRLKKFMPSQKIVAENDDGSIRLSYTVSSQKELYGLIKQWIPHMKVITTPPLIEYCKHVAQEYSELMSKK